mgnify:CR=1 FL=1
MERNELKQLMEKHGAFVHHFGMLVHDRDTAMKYLDNLPGVHGEWFTSEDYWGPDNVIIGKPNVLKIGQIKLFDYTIIELVEPVKGKCQGSYFEQYLQENAEGWHHICYAFPLYDDFREMLDAMPGLGFEVVHHAQGVCAPGTPQQYECEYCYAVPEAGGGIVELNWAGQNRKNNIQEGDDV